VGNKSEHSIGPALLGELVVTAATVIPLVAALWFLPVSLLSKEAGGELSAQCQPEK